MDNKKFYEKVLNQKISDSTWHRDKARMRANGLQISKESLKVYADIKILAKRFSLPIEETIKYFLTFQFSRSATGVEIYFELLKLLPKRQPHRTTIHRWFPAGYKLERIYTVQEISEVLLHAFIYKIRTEKYGTGTQTHRSYQISA